jgi:hypothetical protein
MNQDTEKLQAITGPNRYSRPHPLLFKSNFLDCRNPWATAPILKRVSSESDDPDPIFGIIFCRTAPLLPKRLIYEGLDNLLRSPPLPMGAEGTIWKIITHHLGPNSKLPADRAEVFVVFSILLIFRILRFVVGVQSTLWSCDRGQHMRRYKSRKKGEGETKIMVEREK